MGKIELFEAGEVSAKIQRPFCAKYWPERLLHCCISLGPSKKQIRKTEAQFEVLSNPYYVVNKNHSRTTRKERQRYENNCTLGVNGQGPEPGPMKISQMQ